MNKKKELAKNTIIIFAGKVCTQLISFLLLPLYTLVDRVFRVEHSAAFDTPGHEEIELALFKLYEEASRQKISRTCVLLWRSCS